MKSQILKAMSKLRQLHEHLEEKQDERGAGLTLEVMDQFRGIINLIAETIPPVKKASDSQYQPKDDYDQRPDAYTHIPWKQPMKRQAPIWEHEVHCEYCGSNTIVRSHSPKKPKHCGKKACKTEHTRKLARIRKRRERERKASE